MTTDFTSATILGTKKTTTEKLSFTTQKHIDNNNMFDSLLTNATKSYTSKDVTKSETNHFASKEYISKTKDIDSAKTQKETSTKKSKSTTDVNDNRTVQERETFNSPKNVTNETTDKKVDNNSKTDVEKTSQNELKEDIDTKENNTSEIKEQCKNETEERSEVNEDKSSSENQQEEYNSENKNHKQEKHKEEVTIENENTSKENSNQILNEQILANVELVETLDVCVDSVVQTAQNEKAVSFEQQAEKTIMQNSTTVISETTPTIGSIETTTQNNLLNNVLENLTSEKLTGTQANVIQEVMQEATNLQQTSQEKVLGDSTNIEQNADIEVNTNFIKNTLEKELVAKDLTQKNIPTSENTTRTTQDNLAADTARITLNLENDVALETKTTQLQEKTAITPANTIVENTETQIPTIKVTEEVAAQVEANFANLSQNKDYAGEIKSKAAAKLGDLQGTSTVVTEVQTSTHTNTQNNAQTNLGQNNNSSIQNNATEQIAKLSVEDATTSSDSFLSKLDAKLNGATKANNTQGATLNKSDIMSQMNAKFGEMQQAGQNKVSIILQPENLGKVSVEIMNSKDGIVAKMTTDNQQVKELFDKNIEALKTSLSAQGVNVNNIKVECTNESSNNTMNFEREQFNQNFNNSSNNHNNQTQQSNNSEINYSTEQGFGEEITEELETTNEIKNTETIIKHNGKVDYKV